MTDTTPGQSRFYLAMLSPFRNLAIKLEEVALSRGAPLVLTVLTLIFSFVLVILSQVAGVHGLIDSGRDPPKQVGFASAPNWIVVYLFLYPVFVFVFCLLVGRFREALAIFFEDGTITVQDGETMNIAAFKEYWEGILKIVSIALVVLLGAVILQAVSEWHTMSYLPIVKGIFRDGVPLDWASYAAKYSEAVDRNWTLGFSLLAYAYMASALFVFFAVFIYGAAYCYLLYDMSKRQGPFRMVYRNQAFAQHLSGILVCIWACTILGVMAAYCMQLQTVYLQSNLAHVRELVFANDLNGVKWHLTGSAPWVTSTGIVFYAVVLLSISVFLAREAFNRAKDYLLEKITREDWRIAHNFEWDEQLVENVRSATFFGSVMPWAIAPGLALAALILAKFFIGWGLLLILAAVMVAAIMLQATLRNRLRIAIPVPANTRPPGAGGVPSIPRPPLQVDRMKHESVELLAEILADRALVQGGKDYFRDLIAGANLPTEFKRQRQEGWSGQVLTDARQLIQWADNVGVNPNDPKLTTLASILWSELKGVGPDKAAPIAAIIITEKLIRDRRMMEDFKLRYQFPERPAAAGARPAAIGPDFDVTAGDVELQGFFKSEPDYLDVGFLRKAIVSAAAVCLVDVVGTGRGTGVLIDRDKVLTNYHVLAPTPADDPEVAAKRTRVRFGMFSGAEGAAILDVKVDPETPVLASSPTGALDFVLLKLLVPVNFQRTPAAFTTNVPAPDTALNLLHHPAGGDMKLSLSSNGVSSVDPASGKLQYVTRASSGSSGSPCFNDEWQLVGIHHAERARSFGSIREGILMQNIYIAIGEKIDTMPT
jgi:hypothetical protein